MRARPRPWTAAAQTVVVALLVAAAVAAAGYGWQKVTLRAPSASDLAAARIEFALLHYRYVRSTVHVTGEPTRTAECLEGWEPGANGRPAGQGARVLFSDGERVILGDRRVARLTKPKHPTSLAPVAEVELAGCTRLLSNHIAAKLVSHVRPQAVATTFDGKPVLSVHVRTRRGRFDLYVDRTSLVPVGVRVERNGTTGWSLLTPVRPLTTSMKRGFLRRFDG